MREDARTLSRIAGLASTRAAVAVGLESLPVGPLRAALRAASRARVTPAIDAADLKASSDEVQALLDIGLLWPANASSTSDPLRAQAFRIQPEAITLLPTTAAERSAAPAWAAGTDDASLPAGFRTDSPAALHPVSARIGHNAQSAAVSQSVAETLAVPRLIADLDVSVLVSGGIGKRETSQIANRLGTDLAHAVLLMEMAGRLGWLGVGGPDTDPQWLPTAAWDRALTEDRAHLWGSLVTAWLQSPTDTTHVLAGRTPRGDRIHPLSTPTAAFPGTSSRPPLPFTRFALLGALLDSTASGQTPTGTSDALALDDSALLIALRKQHPLLPSLTAQSVDQLLLEAEHLGLVSTPLGHPRAHALTPAGARIAAAVHAGVPADTAPLGFSLSALEVPADLLADITADLPPLIERIVIQSDLTAVATGPLAPHTASTLDAMADIETRGQGTVYRFTEASLTRAYESGLTETDLRERIADISDTGLPQPLSYLLSDTANRMHRVRIGHARSVIVVDDPADLAAALADPLLIAAHLTQVAPTVATSKLDTARLNELLAAAGIHTLHTAGGQGAPPRARPSTPRSPVTHRSQRIGDGKLESYLAAVRATPATAVASPATTKGSPADTAHLLREAAASSAVVLVDVADSQGTPRTLRLRPRSVAGGRVRGVRTDSSGESEVTLAISRIVRVRPTAG